MSWAKRAPKKRCPIPVYRGPDDEAHALRMAATAAALAVTFGWCGSCGVTVKDDGLHGADCHDVPVERRRAA